MSETILRRTIHPETRVLSDAEGLVEYVASDQTVDSYREVIKSDGWRFKQFKKNAPFLDSHRQDSIEDILGKVVDFKVEKGKLVETVQWAIDVPDNRLAQLGFAMTKAGYAKAVSVGFIPTKRVSKYDNDKKAYSKELEALGMDEEKGPHTIYMEQEQVELSAVVLGANPNALARALKECVLTEGDLEYFSTRRGVNETGLPPIDPALMATQREQAGHIALFLRIMDIARNS